jgi:hypothetical protein
MEMGGRERKVLKVKKKNTRKKKGHTWRQAVEERDIGTKRERDEYQQRCGRH